MIARLLAIAAALAAAAHGPAAWAEPAKNQHDLLFLGDRRPVLIRLHLWINGQDSEAPWGEAIRGLYKHLDTDGDGRLTSEEQARGYALRTHLKTIERNRPGLIVQEAGSSLGSPAVMSSADRLIDLLRPSFGPLLFQLTAPGSTATELLFKHLDRDGDHSLSRAELEGAEASLQGLDHDDDQTIQLEEVQPYTNPFFRRGQQFNPEKSQTTLPSPFVILSPNGPRTHLIRTLMTRYDRAPKDHKLGREEIRLGAENFDRADADGDGELDSDELAHLYANGASDLDLEIHLGGGGRARAEVLPSGEKQAPLAANTRKAGDGGLDLLLDGVQLEIRGEPQLAVPDVQQLFQNQFSVLDSDKNMYLDRTEARGGIIRGEIFEVLDRDGDGKLFKKEMNDFLAVEHALAWSRTTLTGNDQGRSMFEVLDVDRDRRLSVRETRAVLKRVAAWDRDGDGRVALEEVPRHLRLSFSRGYSLLLAQRGFRTDIAVSAGFPTARPGQGPGWFVKMDRNQDGDLSRREFLGAPADFNRLDADRDGLLDANEARNAK